MGLYSNAKRADALFETMDDKKILLAFSMLDNIDMYLNNFANNTRMIGELVEQIETLSNNVNRMLDILEKRV